MGPQAELVDLVLPLVGDPRLDEVRGEDVAAEQELVVLLQGDEGLVEAVGTVLTFASSSGGRW